MKASASTRSEGRKTVRRRSLPRRPRCRDCPFRAPSGKCLNRTIKSGRCGDWVWYMRGRKQWRRLYVKPKDPRTPEQRHWRARFGVASNKYSQSLTDEQRDAYIALGTKLRSRPRLGQSGPLTGQQYAIRREYAANAKERLRSAEKREKVLPTQGFLRSTSGTHQGAAGVPRGYHRRGMGWASRCGAGSRGGEYGRLNRKAASEVSQPRMVRRFIGVRYRRLTRPLRSQAA